MSPPPPNGQSLNLKFSHAYRMAQMDQISRCYILQHRARRPTDMNVELQRCRWVLAAHYDHLVCFAATMFACHSSTSRVASDKCRIHYLWKHTLHLKLTLFLQTVFADRFRQNEKFRRKLYSFFLPKFTTLSPLVLGFSVAYRTNARQLQFHATVKTPSWPLSGAGNNTKYDAPSHQSAAKKATQVGGCNPKASLPASHLSASKLIPNRLAVSAYIKMVYLRTIYSFFQSYPQV